MIKTVRVWLCDTSLRDN